MDGGEVLVVMMSSLGILAGVAVIWMAMQSRRQIREMEHRERLAMIERGLVPAAGGRSRRLRAEVWRRACAAIARVPSGPAAPEWS